MYMYMCMYLCLCSVMGMWREVRCCRVLASLHCPGLAGHHHSIVPLPPFDSIITTLLLSFVVGGFDTISGGWCVCWKKLPCTHVSIFFCYISINRVYIVELCYYWYMSTCVYTCKWVCMCTCVCACALIGKTRLPRTLIHLPGVLYLIFRELVSWMHVMLLT